MRAHDRSLEIQIEDTFERFRLKFDKLSYYLTAVRFTVDLVVMTGKLLLDFKFRSTILLRTPPRILARSQTP